MKGMKSLQENLKNLPKYTLNEGQKKRISLALQEEMKPRKSMQFARPFIAFAFICTTVFVLVLSNDNDSNNWFNELRQSFQPQVELTSQQAVTFNLADSNYELTGIKDKVGMLFNEQFVAEDARRGAKMMLYFFGDALEFTDKNYRVEARNIYNKKITLTEGVFNGFLFGEDVQQILTSFQPLPTEGQWQLSFYVEDYLFEEFTIDVLPPLPKTEQYTLINHPMEFTVGEETELIIEGSAESENGLEVKLLNEKGSIVSEHVFIQDGTFIRGAGGYIYHYRGNIKFPEQGTWTLIIDGEKTKPFKN